MKPTTLYLLAFLAVFSVAGYVHASDSDSDYFYGGGSVTDDEMRKFNERLDRLADVTQVAYQRRLTEENAKRAAKNLPELNEEEKKKIFKECFQQKFDYAQHEVGEGGTIFEIGNRNIFDQDEI